MELSSSTVSNNFSGGNRALCAARKSCSYYNIFFITVTIKCLYFLIKYSIRSKRYPSSAPFFPNGLRQWVDWAQILHRMLFLTAIFLFITVCNRHYDCAAVWPQRQGLCVLPVLGWESSTWKVNALNTEPWSHFTYFFLNICVYNQIYDVDIDVPVG